MSSHLARLEELLDCKFDDWNSLQNIHLAFRGITELPPEVSSWSAATTIDLGGNRLTSLPETVSGWSAATYINLRGNQLTDLPDGVSGWSATVTINLDGNRLTCLPDGVSGWSAATRIWLSDNQLASLPIAVGGWSAAMTIDLRSNRLTCLPETVAGFAGARESPANGWRAARYIYLDGNSILFVDDDLCEKCRSPFGYDYGTDDKYFSLQNKKKIQERYVRKIQKIYRQHQERRKAAAVVIQRHYKNYFYRVGGPWYTTVKEQYLQFNNTKVVQVSFRDV